jgi:Domain of unknown function DUF11
VVLTLTASNLSTNDTAGAHAELTLSALLAYTSASGATCTAASSVVSCDLGTIAGGASKVVSITVNAATAGTANSSATVGGAAPDPVTTNNSASAAMIVSAPLPPPTPPSSGGGGGGGAFDYSSIVALLALLGYLELARRRRVSR